MPCLALCPSRLCSLRSPSLATCTLAKWMLFAAMWALSAIDTLPHTIGSWGFLGMVAAHFLEWLVVFGWFGRSWRKNQNPWQHLLPTVCFGFLYDVRWAAFAPAASAATHLPLPCSPPPPSPRSPPLVAAAPYKQALVPTLGSGQEVTATERMRRRMSECHIMHEVP